MPEKPIPPVEEVPVSASALNNAGTGLFFMGLAALVQAGVMDIDEARKQAGLPPLTKSQYARLSATARWSLGTGKILPANLAKWYSECIG